MRAPRPTELCLAYCITCSLDKVQACSDSMLTACRTPPEELQRKLAARYPVADFNAARKRLDPKNILSNPLMDAMFPRTDV